MSKLADVMQYICANYPFPDELSNARLTKMVYLSDWRHALRTGDPITNIQWVFNHYGPFVEDVKSEAESNKAFKIGVVDNFYGNPKRLISVESKDKKVYLTNDEKSAIDRVIEVTKNKYWDDFIKLVYSTFPVMSQERHSVLDLKELAVEYKTQKAEAS
jgi:hypothetical protein